MGLILAFQKSLALQDMNDAWKDYTETFNKLTATKDNLSAVAEKKKAGLKRKIAQTQAREKICIYHT